MFNFLKDRRGVTALEYALLGAALGLVLVTVLRLPVQKLADQFATAMHTPQPSP